MIASGKKIYLCRPNQEIVTQLNGIRISSVNYDEHLKDYSQLTFEVDRFIAVDGRKYESSGYNQLHAYMELYLEDIGYFQIQEPSISNDGQAEFKSVTAYSLEKEFEDKDLIDFKVNTGEKDSLEYLDTTNVNPAGFSIDPILFYRPEKPSLSLLHLVLEKMPGWTVCDEDIDPLLWATKQSFDENSINIYAFLTSKLAPKAECIFLFDTLKKCIKAYSKYSLDFETNVFIGLRNLAQTIDISCTEDSIYTRFNACGDDELDIRDVNYNDPRIFDLSYFMSENYMSSELIKKIQKWIKFREEHREEYIRLSKTWTDLDTKILEIINRQPNDGDYWKQWDEMTEELLLKNQEYYQTLLTSLQVSVDPSPKYDTDPDGNKVYIPWSKSNESGETVIDHDRYLDLLYQLANGYGGYFTYYEILNYILPNIEIAISNLDVPEDDKKDYIKDFETNWDLYGISELKALLEKHRTAMYSLEEKGYHKHWADLTPEEKAAFNNSEESYDRAGHAEYERNRELIGSETTTGSLLYKLDKLQSELAQLETQKESVSKQRKSLIEEAGMNNPLFSFTEEDRIIINELFHDTDYTNSNIIVTTADTTITKIDRELKLYEDSVSKLSEVSQPQYTFTADIDNLLCLKEFQAWQKDFTLLHYIRLGIRDDYSVKLRIVGRSWNPCENTPNLNVTFSNMITSRSGRSDLTDLLNSDDNRGSKNSISFGTGNAKNEKEYLTSMLQLMINSQLFSNAVGNIASGVIIPENSQIRLHSLVSDYIKATDINVGQIIGDEGAFKKFFVDYLDVNYIVSNINVTELLMAGGIITNDVNSATGHFTNYLTGVKILGDLIEAHTLIADKIILRGANSVMLALNDLSELTQEHLTPEEVRKYQLDGTNIIAETITAKQISVDELFVTKLGSFLELNVSEKAWIKNLTTITTNIGNWEIKDNNISGGLNSIITGGYLKSKNYRSDSLGNTITGCIIDLNNFEIDSPDFSLSNDGIVMRGNITLLPGSHVPGNSVDMGDKTLDEVINEADKKLEDNIQYRLEGDSSAGTVFSNNLIDTTLSVILYRGNIAVTDQYPDTCFIWTRESSDSSLDQYWNSQHTQGSKTVHIISEDIVGKKTKFRCSFRLGNSIRAAALF